MPKQPTQQQVDAAREGLNDPAKLANFGKSLPTPGRNQSFGDYVDLIQQRATKAFGDSFGTDSEMMTLYDLASKGFQRAGRRKEIPNPEEFDGYAFGPGPSSAGGIAGGTVNTPMMDIGGGIKIR